MKRRQFIAASAMALVVPGARLNAAGSAVQDYSRAAYEAALASGEPFMLDFYASW